MKNIVVLGTPKCGHAYLTKLLTYIYRLKGIRETEIINFNRSFSNEEDQYIFNSHAFPMPNLVTYLQQNNFFIVCPIRNPHDQLFSLLLFYRRQKRELLNEFNASLIDDGSSPLGCLINNNVRDYVLSGKYEADYVNSFLWQKMGGTLVFFEQLMHSPLNTIISLCNQIEREGIFERKVLSAYYAASVDLLSNEDASRHVSQFSSPLAKRYDWQSQIEAYPFATEVSNYLSNSKIYINYPKNIDNFFVPKHNIIFDSDTPKIIKQLFFLSEFFLNASNDQSAYDEFARYAVSNVAIDDSVYVPGFAYELWNSRSDLKEAFPCPLNVDRVAFVRWILSQCSQEYDMPQSWYSKIYQSLF
jgi:hypothetical protein